MKGVGAQLGMIVTGVGDNWGKGGAVEVSHCSSSPMAAKTCTQSGSTRSGRLGAADIQLFPLRVP